jgi:hypothetical protein
MDAKADRVRVVSGAGGLESAAPQGANPKWIVKLGGTRDAPAVTAALKDRLATRIDPLCVARR